MLGISGLLNIIKLKVLAVPDPDFEIRGGGGWGGGHPDPLIKKKNFFRPFGPKFDIKIRK